ncbi:MAG: hypothetical protein DRN12_03560 [Thermoplasmata archaeon]|nr:MAG: hypothetical protein DRN12_03560 [Thermoplasmata archaeon]
MSDRVLNWFFVISFDLSISSNGTTIRYISKTISSVSKEKSEGSILNQPLSITIILYFGLFHTKILKRKI